ncbi:MULTISPECIES: aldo/keto reductase [unclassified Paenibacillus]|uniref:aldo/keto reductase n=1 Tax=unclassified Paenibacillus TaxID=185978 RepID=UPI0024077688|nr:MULTISPECIES: aldo/keto reductase [unclassified Paenibacillus]MDF9842962.1 aryl-alcohol dehydrogenase-like predicted oxidoreductase [Paenibacillus sp. PastF-2]MDF9849550.1 aryl-alcohol dehydrogenase-like predicted oxidoreductase [Paenibacillus sp. PastM-2]MDF9856075.1 aryl-alcohol dehydrogenase-like predicted oxidoreductase [Paenibacillus sp. PastF-1]MDH6481393.1 aryl-alcohol dehydrogenase-like predicted oxidoreductase [Paenibacillus sp. PastH-2]MDH6508764.1 aryl-alcohol dehydrogenase-like 
MSTVTAETSLRPLGQSELSVSPLGLGCWQFSRGSGIVGKYWSNLEDTDILDIVRVSLEGGMNWVDTAEIYGGGKSEQALAAALDQLKLAGSARAEPLIATKWWPLFRTAGSIPATIDERIRCLGGRQIDLYQIHQPFSLSSIASEMKAMAGLVKAGKIRYAGVSNYSAGQMVKAHRLLQEHGLKLVSNQVKYNLLHRSIDRNGTMAAAKELGISIIAYSPLQQGVLTGRFHNDPEQISKLSMIRRLQSGLDEKGLARSKPLIDLLADLAGKYGVTHGQVALNWLIHFHGDTVVAIPGASKVRHAKENIGAMGFRLNEHELQQLDDASWAALK